MNLIGVKHLTRFIGCLHFSIKWAIINREEKRIILLYSLNSALSYAALMVSRLFHIKAVAVVTDPPSVDLPGEAWVTSILRKIDRLLIVTAMQHMHGLVVLVKSLAEAFAPKVPHIVMEGIASHDDIDKSQKAAFFDDCPVERNKFIIMYAGGLAEEYGIKLLLSAFDSIHEDDYQLWIFGKRPLGRICEERRERRLKNYFWGCSFQYGDTRKTESSEYTH